MSTTIRCGVASLDRTEHFPERCSLPRMKWKEKGVFLLSFFLVFLLVLMGRFYSKAALNVSFCHDFLWSLLISERIRLHVAKTP